MPKRKAPDEDLQAEESSTPKKKSKKEMAKEARAKAKAWHDQRNAAKSSTTATTTTTTSPTFSTGTSAKKSTPATEKKSPKKRTTPTRKSTGGIKSGSSTKASPTRRSRRSVGVSSSTTKQFEFVPPPVHEEEEEEESDDTVPVKLDLSNVSSRKKKSPIKSMEVDNSSSEEDDDDSTTVVAEEQEKKPSAKKAKKQDGLAAIQKLKEERERKGLKVTSSTSAEKNKMKNLKSPDPPSNKSPAAAAAVNDEQKMSSASRPSPPGRNGTTVQPQQQQPPVNDPGALRAASARAMSLVAAAKGENILRRDSLRRAMMGIRDTTTAYIGGGGNRQRNNVMMSEQQMDEVNATLDNDEVGGGRLQADPPTTTVVKKTSSVAATLQKFRGAKVGGSVTKLKEPETTAATTVAGENTSEVGEKGGNVTHQRPAEYTDGFDEKKPSFVKKLGNICLLIGKLLMFVTLGIGFIYTVTTALKNLSDTSSLSKTLESDGNIQTTTASSVEQFSCFIDYPVQDNIVSDSSDDDEDDDQDDKCEGKYKQCPPWGQCKDGKLQDCNDGEGSILDGMVRFVVNDLGDECVISPEANELTRLVQETLVDMTTEQVCRSSSSSSSNDDEFPLFSLYSVAARVKPSASSAEDKEEYVGLKPDILIWLRPVFDSKLVRFGALSGDDEDDVDALGLGDGVLPNSLPLPFGCTAKLLAMEMLQFFCTSALAVLTFATIKFWQLLWAYPLYTIGFVAFLKLVTWFRQRRKRIAKIKSLRDVVLNLTLDRLSECNDHEGWAVLMLRDDVASYLHPTNWTERQFIIDYVWPSVYVLIQADNRVRKFRKMAHGRQLEHWDFDVQSKKMRKSLGTPRLPAPLPTSEKNEDISPKQKRDP